MFRILVCGDRDWSDGERIKRELERFVFIEQDFDTVDRAEIVIIHGAARGADTLAGEAAEELGFKVDPFPADWDNFGRAAGAIRNKRMLAEGRPHAVLGFHNDIEKSKGTKDMLRQSLKAGVEEVYLYTDSGRWEAIELLH